jgi:hypothetical protein
MLRSLLLTLTIAVNRCQPSSGYSDSWEGRLRPGVLFLPPQPLSDLRTTIHLGQQPGSERFGAPQFGRAIEVRPHQECAARSLP